MGKELNELTLIGREEKRGKKYPLYLERISLIISIFFTIYLVNMILNNYDINVWLKIPLNFCLAPIFALSMAEVIGRNIQKIFS